MTIKTIKTDDITTPNGAQLRVAIRMKPSGDMFFHLKCLVCQEEETWDTTDPAKDSSRVLLWSGSHSHGDQAA